MTAPPIARFAGHQVDHAISRSRGVNATFENGQTTQSFTLPLRDSLSYAQSTGRTFDLYVRQDTYLTGPLRDAIGRGDINRRFNS